MALQSTDVFLVNRDGVNYQVTLNDLIAKVNSYATSYTPITGSIQGLYKTTSQGTGAWVFPTGSSAGTDNLANMGTYTQAIADVLLVSNVDVTLFNGLDPRPPVKNYMLNGATVVVGIPTDTLISVQGRGWMQVSFGNGANTTAKTFSPGVWFFPSVNFRGASIDAENMSNLVMGLFGGFNLLGGRLSPCNLDGGNNAPLSSLTVEAQAAVAAMRAAGVILNFN